jgi:hypothetical protein
MPCSANESDALLFHDFILAGDDTLICVKNPPVGCFVVGQVHTRFHKRLAHLANFLGARLDPPLPVSIVHCLAYQYLSCNCGA